MVCCALGPASEHVTGKIDAVYSMQFLGGPHWYKDSGGAPTQEFGPILPSDEADMCRFPGLHNT